MSVFKPFLPEWEETTEEEFRQTLTKEELEVREWVMS
jgi:hypothetical protein